MPGGAAASRCHRRRSGPAPDGPDGARGHECRRHHHERPQRGLPPPRWGGGSRCAGAGHRQPKRPRSRVTVRRRHAVGDRVRPGRPERARADAVGTDHRHRRERGLQPLVEGGAHPVGPDREAGAVRGLGGYPGGVRQRRRRAASRPGPWWPATGSIGRRPPDLSRASPQQHEVDAGGGDDHCRTSQQACRGVRCLRIGWGGVLVRPRRPRRQCQPARRTFRLAAAGRRLGQL